MGSANRRNSLLRVNFNGSNGSSYVSYQSNNGTNGNSSVSYLNLNNSASNTNSNISSQLFYCSITGKRDVSFEQLFLMPHLLVKNKEWTSKYCH